MEPDYEDFDDDVMPVRGAHQCRGCVGFGYYYFDHSTSEKHILHDEEATGFWLDGRDDLYVDILDCSNCGGSGYDAERGQRRLV